MKLRTLAFVQMPACYRNIIVGFVLALVPVLAHAVYDPILRSGFESTPTFYVAGNGNNANPGTLAQPWKTINRAVRDGNGAPAGSIVYVKAGTYHEQVIIERDDIQLIGYTSVPGDQPPILANAPINPDNGNPVFPAFDPNQMPLLDGGNRASGIGINLRNRRGISVRNFNVRNYAYGLIAGSEDPAFIESHLLDNVNVSTIGDITAEYSGIGIGLGSMSTQFSNGSRVQNALIINAAAEGLKLSGDDNEARNIRVYSTEGDTEESSTDYYVIVTGSRNRVSGSYIWRKPESAHSGHGYTIKDNADQLAGGPLIEPTGNIFENNVAVFMGEGFVVRHRGVHHNTFINGTAYGNYDGFSESCGSGNGIVLRDGAHSNDFINVHMVNTCEAIVIGDSSEDEASPTPLLAASGNRIIAAEIQRSYIGLMFTDYYAAGRDAGDNTIIDSNFNLVRFMFIAMRPVQQMRYQDTVFGGTEGTGFSEGWFRGGSYAEQVLRSQFTNCTFPNVDLPPGW